FAAVQIAVLNRRDQDSSASTLPGTALACATMATPASRSTLANPPPSPARRRRQTPLPSVLEQAHLPRRRPRAERQFGLVLIGRGLGGANTPWNRVRCMVAAASTP